MKNELARAAPGRRQMTLLRPVCEGPLSALFVASSRQDDVVSLVAVKVLRTRHARDAEQFARLRATGRRLASLEHRHVIAPTEVGLVDGNPALVSPWVDGVDLLDWCEVLRETNKVLPTRVVCEIMRGGATALDAAYNRVPWLESEALQLQHRDIKPANFMVSRDGELKLLDFGTGLTSLGGRNGRATAVTAGLGRYLAPGRRQGKRGGPASDIYALGIVGIELLANRWLQRVKDENPAHDRHLAEVVASLPDGFTRSPQDDRTLRALLLRMVAFDPEARPVAAEVAHTMRTLADRSPGPSLEAFAHDHALPYALPSDPGEGLPEARLVEPEELLQLLLPDAGPVSDELEAGADEDFDEGPHLPHVARSKQAAPADEAVHHVAVQPAPTTRAAASPLLAGAALGGVVVAAGASLVLGVVVGILLALVF